MLERFSEEQRVVQEQARSASAHQEKELLDRRSQEIEEDQRKFAEAAIKLGRDKAALEVHIRRMTTVPSTNLEHLLRLSVSASWKRNVRGK